MKRSATNSDWLVQAVQNISAYSADWPGQAVQKRSAASTDWPVQAVQNNNAYGTDCRVKQYMKRSASSTHWPVQAVQGVRSTSSTFRPVLPHTVHCQTTSTNVNNIFHSLKCNGQSKQKRGAARWGSTTMTWQRKQVPARGSMVYRDKPPPWNTRREVREVTPQPYVCQYISNSGNPSDHFHWLARRSHRSRCWSWDSGGQVTNRGSPGPLGTAEGGSSSRNSGGGCRRRRPAESARTGPSCTAANPRGHTSISMTQPTTLPKVMHDRPP